MALTRRVLFGLPFAGVLFGGPPAKGDMPPALAGPVDTGRGNDRDLDRLIARVEAA